VLYWVVKNSAALLIRTLFGLRVSGVERLPRSGPFLLVANHVSFFDPAAAAVACPRPLCYMAKAELFRVPFLGWLIRHVNSFPVEREGADPAAFRTALALLAEGKGLLIFPEGTRGREGILRPGKAGAGMLALRSGVSVVPVYIRGTGTALGRGQRWPRFVPLTVAFGPPLDIRREPPRKAAYEAIASQMMEAIARLQEEVTGQPARWEGRPAALHSPL